MPRSPLSSAPQFSQRLPLVAALFAGILLGTAVTIPHYQVLAIVSVVGALLLALALASPEPCLLALLLTRPVVDAFVLVNLGPVSLGKAWTIALLGLVLLVLLSKTGARPGNLPFEIAAFTLASTYALITVSRAPHMLALENTLRLATFPLLALAIETIGRSSHGFTRVFRCGLALACVTCGVIGVLTALGRYGSAYYLAKSAYRSDVMAAPHGLASLAVLCLPFAAIGIIRQQYVVWSWVLAVALSVAVVASFTRTTLIALVLVWMIVLGTLFVRGRLGRLALAIAGLAVSGLLVAQFALEAVAERLGAGGWSAYVTPEGGSGRYGLWRGFIDALVSDPSYLLFGGGAAAPMDIIMNTRGGLGVTQNDFLTLTAAGGVLVLAAYCTLIVWSWRSLRFGLAPEPAADTIALTAVARSGVIAFVFMSAVNGMVFGMAGIPLAMMVGLSRSTRTSRGDLGGESFTRER